MQSINISKRKYESLKPIELPKSVISTEAKFYKMPYLKKVKVFKNLYKTNGPIFANKLFTLEMLNEYREILPESFVLPEALCSVDKEVKGFVLPYVQGVTLEDYLSNRKNNPQDQLRYIAKIGDILDQMAHIRKNSALDSIYLNDLHASNFIIDAKKKDLRVVDLDSCRICDAKPFPARYLHPFSLLNRAPGENKYDIYKKELIGPDGIPIMNFALSDEAYDEYEKEYCKYKNYRDELGFVNSNENSDLYCYVILFLNYLYGGNVGSFTLEKFYEYMYYLEYLNFDSELLSAIHLILTGAPNKNIGPYLETVTDEQVARAHENVYKAAKSKKLVF
jgi:tRNA A-37 threonylcarbamoyl transferase component Bud32